MKGMTFLNVNIHSLRFNAWHQNKIVFSQQGARSISLNFVLIKETKDHKTQTASYLDDV